MSITFKIERMPESRNLGDYWIDTKLPDGEKTSGWGDRKFILDYISRKLTRLEVKKP